MGDEYIAPKCKWDFAASMRERIIDDVASNGETYRCSSQMATAFSGYDHKQIEQWCAEQNLAIIARHDDRIVIVGSDE